MSLTSHLRFGKSQEHQCLQAHRRDARLLAVLNSDLQAQTAPCLMGRLHTRRSVPQTGTDSPSMGFIACTKIQQCTAPEFLRGRSTGALHSLNTSAMHLNT
jgi:hypothetical protein